MCVRSGVALVSMRGWGPFVFESVQRLLWCFVIVSKLFLASLVADTCQISGTCLVSDYSIILEIGLVF